ncbi:sigma factor-like helix-turn-helix DNA-binding protein [Streptomyces sp. NPDC001922]|uniref:sigma factor-like helix-turn-helix DNA-binding protein n=1 Tax=Streptomyces sp. NPDC001922 TaxID=3364624 RepID=UPI00369917DD
MTRGRHHRKPRPAARRTPDPAAARPDTAHLHSVGLDSGRLGSARLGRDCLDRGCPDSARPAAEELPTRPTPTAPPSGAAARATVRGGTAPGAPGFRRTSPPGRTPYAAVSAPAQAFETLCAAHTAALVRQVTVLTGRRRLARRAVDRAFHQAWQHWPEVAADRDPAGWVRAAAYEYALSPWHQPWLRRRPPAGTASGPDRALFAAVLALPRCYRRVLLLHDGVGLGLPETAAEVEATLPAAASRLARARAAVVARLPEIGEAPPALYGGILGRRLDGLTSAQPVRAVSARAVRLGSERRTRRWTAAAYSISGVFVVTTAVFAVLSPGRYVAEFRERPAVTASDPSAADPSAPDPSAADPAAGP